MFSSKLQQKEVNHPVVPEKLMFFLLLETSIVASRPVLDELLCFLSCPEFDILPIFFSWNLSSLLFSEICPENSHKIPAKLAVFSGNLSLSISWNLTFFPQIIRSPGLCSSKRRLSIGLMTLQAEVTNTCARKQNNIFIYQLFILVMLTKLLFCYLLEESLYLLQIVVFHDYQSLIKREFSFIR